ncbi:hypothetical protein [Adhaeribacter aquaticus]|uniref:hypothetical protein n=1 Tax=Adhaeribacter aquaticus TaxID=299567 RepID=UPI0003FAFA35|nr:hypothetical protein [Adhaeribacter aquaticus]
MLEEIKKRLMLRQIHRFTIEECEDRLMLIRYLQRREELHAYQQEFQDYIIKIEYRLANLKKELE